jgi:hypothetical protein
MRQAVFLVGLALLARPAQADVQDYCTAVARDFADLRPKDRDIWQQRYDGANSDCIEQFSAPAAVAATAPKPRKKIAVAKPSKPEAVEIKPAPVDVKTKKKIRKPVAEVATVEGATAEPTARAAGTRPKLTPGSPEWQDYCERKYTSFNREKGTYLSKTGVERKCLVTSEFK